MTTLVYHQIRQKEDRVMPLYTSAILVRIHRPRGLTLHTIISADRLPKHKPEVSMTTPVTNRTSFKLMTSFKQQTNMTIQTDAFKKLKRVMKYTTIYRKTRTDNEFSTTEAALNFLYILDNRIKYISYEDTLLYQFFCPASKRFKIQLFQILNFLSCIKTFQNTIVSNIESWNLTN